MENSWQESTLKDPFNGIFVQEGSENVSESVQGESLGKITAQGLVFELIKLFNLFGDQIS